MTVMVIGIDPGITTGVGIVSAKGVVDAWQEEQDASLRRLVRWLRENREAAGMIGVEDAFVGKGAHASLEVARSGGCAEGALMIAGYPRDQMVRLHPSTWRSELGIKGKNREAKEAQARLYAGKILGRTLADDETHMAEALCMAQVMVGRFSRKFESTVWRNRG